MDIYQVEYFEENPTKIYSELFFAESDIEAKYKVCDMVKKGNKVFNLRKQVTKFETIQKYKV